MTPSDFLQSRWVASQIQLGKKQSTLGHAESHAILAWMWVVLKIGTAWQVIAILVHFLAVSLHLIQPPRKAAAIAQSERNARAQAEADVKKFTEETMKNLANTPDPTAEKAGTS